MCLCVVWSVAVQTLYSFAKCSREYSKRLKNITETTKDSEGGKEQRSSTIKMQDVKETFWQGKSTKKTAFKFNIQHKLWFQEGRL